MHVLVLKAHRRLYHSTLSLRVIKKKKRVLVHLHYRRLLSGVGFSFFGFRVSGSVFWFQVLISGFGLRSSGFGFWLQVSGFRIRGGDNLCEDRIGTGPPRARTEVIYVDLGYWAISGRIYTVGAVGQLETLCHGHN